MPRNHWGLIAQTSAARVYWLIATLVTTTITARYLGPAGRGVYVAAVSWVTAFYTFGYLSLSQVVVFMATGKNAREWLPRVTGTLMTILASIAVLGWIVAGFLYAATGGRLFQNLSPIALVVIFAALPCYLWIENGNGVLMALGKLSVLNVAQVAGATAALFLTFVFVGVVRWGVIGGLAALGLSQAVIVAITMTYILRRSGAVRFDRDAARELLGGGAKLHLNAIGTYLFTQANVLILNNFRSPQETAFFQLAVQLVTAIQVIPLAVSTVAYSLIAEKGPDGAWPQHRRLLFQTVLLVTGTGIVAYFASPFAVRVIFGPSFIPSVPLFRLLLLAIIGMTASIVMASQWIGRGYFVQAAMITLVVGTVSVVANLFVVPRWGTYGAAWVTIGTYGISLLTNGGMAVFAESRWRRREVMSYV